MNETNEEFPETFTKALEAQRGKPANEHVSVTWNKDRGDILTRSIDFGKASMVALWSFDREGTLTYVAIVKSMKDSSGMDKIVGGEELHRDNEGNFYRSAQPSHQEAGLREWKEEFKNHQTVATRS